MPGLRGTARRFIARSQARRKMRNMTRKLSAGLAAYKKLKSTVAQRRVARANQLIRHERKYRLSPFHKSLNNAGGVITRSSYGATGVMSGKDYVRRNAAQPTYLVQNTPTQFNALCGEQGIFWLGLQNRSQLQQYFAQIPSSTPTNNKTRAIFVDYTIATSHYTNASNASCTIDLYDVVVKQDNDIASPLQAWSDGITMELVTPGTGSINSLGILPNMSEQFKEFFKIVNVTHVNLAAGATHCHNISLKPRKVCKEQRVQENVNMTGWTYFTLVVVRGVPVSDKTGQDPAVREVSSAPIAIDVVYTISSKFRWIADIDTDLTVINGMVTLVNPDVMNTFNSQAVPVVQTN